MSFPIMTSDDVDLYAVNADFDFQELDSWDVPPAQFPNIITDETDAAISAYLKQTPAPEQEQNEDHVNNSDALQHNQQADIEEELSAPPQDQNTDAGNSAHYPQQTQHVSDADFESLMNSLEDPAVVNSFLDSYVSVFPAHAQQAQGRSDTDSLALMNSVGPVVASDAPEQDLLTETITAHERNQIDPQRLDLDSIMDDVYGQQADHILGVSSFPDDEVPHRVSPNQPSHDGTAEQDVVYDGFRPDRPKFDADHSWVRFNNLAPIESTRSGKINQYVPSKVYKKLPNPFRAWKSGVYTFDYTTVGELDEAVYTTDQIRHFIYNHPTTEDSRLTLWIQRAPADSARRYETPASSKCRFGKCPTRREFAGTITQGHYRVALDEKWHKYGEETDPFHVAAYVHLYCLERFLDFPDICRRFDVRSDIRNLSKEPNHKLAASLIGTGEAVKTRGFLESCRSGTLQSRFPNYPIHAWYKGGAPKPHAHTLTCALNVAKSNVRKPPKSVTTQVKESKGSQRHVHMGDLEMYCTARVSGRKYKRSNEGPQQFFEAASDKAATASGAGTPEDRLSDHSARPELTQQVSALGKRKRWNAASTVAALPEFEDQPSKRAKPNDGQTVGSRRRGPSPPHLDTNIRMLHAHNTRLATVRRDPAQAAANATDTALITVRASTTENGTLTSAAVSTMAGTRPAAGVARSVNDSPPTVIDLVSPPAVIDLVSPEQAYSARSSSSKNSFSSLFVTPPSSAGLRRSPRLMGLGSTAPMSPAKPLSARSSASNKSYSSLFGTPPSSAGLRRSARLASVASASPTKV